MALCLLLLYHTKFNVSALKGSDLKQVVPCPAYCCPLSYTGCTESLIKRHCWEIKAFQKAVNVTMKTGCLTGKQNRELLTEEVIQLIIVLRVMALLLLRNPYIVSLAPANELKKPARLP